MAKLNKKRLLGGDTQGMLPEADLLIAVLRRMANSQGVLTESDVQRAKAMLGIGTPMARGIQAGQAVRGAVQRVARVPQRLVQAGQGFFQGLGGATGQNVQPYDAGQRAGLLAQGNYNSWRSNQGFPPLVNNPRTPVPPRLAPSPRAYYLTDPMRPVNPPRTLPKTMPMTEQFRSLPNARTAPKTGTGGITKAIKNTIDARRAQLIAGILGM